MQHWLLECERWKDERANLFQKLSRVALGFDLMTDDDKLVAILDQASLNPQDYLKDVDCSF